MRRIKILFVSLLLGLPAMVSALGLGQIEPESGLNQPFEARIELLSPTADELSSLSVSLADSEAFKRAGVERLFVLSNLRFEVKENENGPDYIRVYSKDPIREPYLNFLVEADWSKGRLYREYTVLLDPPLYDPNARKPVVSMPQVQEQETAPAEEQVYVPSQPGEGETGAAGGTTRGMTGTPGEYGPTVASDTLWSIASSIRPDDSISVQQMMLAILQANPDAFLDNNINGLKRGEILRIPNRDEILAMTQAQALAEARSQNTAWQEARGNMAAATPTRPVTTGTPATGEETSSAAAPEESSELRLMAASDAGAGTDQGDTGAAAGRGGDSGAALALANEQLEALTQENKDLKDRLAESESIIKDLKRLVSMKDDELAALQNQQAEKEQPGQAVTGAETGEAPAPTAGEEEAATTGQAPAAEKESAAEEAAPPEPEEKPATGVVTETRPISSPKGTVAQIIDMVMAYKVYVGGGVGGLLIIIIGYVVVSRRRRGKEEEFEPLETATAAPVTTDFAGSEDETILPGEAVEEVESEAAAGLPEGAIEADEEEMPAAVEEAVPAAAAEETAAAPAQEHEEDPLAEVNVFLAYEHFDQAEEFVRDAITGNPDNLDFHTKLLEVFYASGDKAKYEDAARVLHEKTNGEGSHWEMAVAMWSEMSPGRALFEEGGAEEEAPAAAGGGGGVLDLTAGEEAEENTGGAADMGLDFDLGDTTDVPSPAEDEEQGEDLLDVTAAVSMEDVGSDEDLLDVTAAVGLEPDLETAPGSEDEMLDITSGSEEPSEDLLDVSSQSGDDLLDVTAQSEADALSSEEDLLDVTAATSAGADSEELLELGGEAGAPAEEEDNSLDFDIGGADEPTLEVPASAEEGTVELDIGGADEESGGDNVIEFESAAPDTAEGEGEGLDISMSEEGGEEGLDFNIGFDTEEEETSGADSGLSIDEGEDDSENTMDIKLEDYAAGTDEESAGTAGDDLEIDLGVDDSGAGEEEPSLDLATDDEADSGIELDLTAEGDESADSGLELELDTGDAESSVSEDEDIEATVKMPEIDSDLSLDDDDDHTVFVPRSGDAQEQSDEDEIATKLDLAKAYVELGDKDSAKGILEEIISDGNEQQRMTAQELLKQVS